MRAAVKKFQDVTCKAYETRELPKEQAARGRRAAATATQRKAATATSTTAAKTGSKLKTLNMNTYKWHSLPDYPDVVEELGPTDNTTTQSVIFSSLLFPYARTDII